MNSRPRLPTVAETPVARRVLVLAPHPDDEVLGCGGLVAQLADRGASVEVLFLTDGGGGEEEVGDRGAYGARRRAEIEAAAAILGLHAWHQEALPDGALARHRPQAAAAIVRELLSQRPDLVLVPSPRELSADHRAAFAALHDALSPVRAGDALADLLPTLNVLAYEINGPGDPDLLVDISAELPRLERAMACHASQEERHPYWRAALGLRRFRTLTLGHGVAAAEGYRRLRADDFRLRSLAGLAAHLGATIDPFELREGPPISVVVRTRDRPELLAEALASLAASTYRRLEVVLVNDGGVAPVIAADFPFPLVRVDLPASAGRAAAANAGIAAASETFIGFLDDDDLVEPEHFALLVDEAMTSGAPVVYSDAAVGIYAVDGAARKELERRLPYSRDFDPELLLLDNYIPFNTLLIAAARLAEVGPLDAELPFFEDWDLLIRLAERTPFRHLPKVTCEYRHFRGGGQIFGEQPRQRADFLAVKAKVLARHAFRLTPQRLAAVVDRLRAEAVQQSEAARGARLDAQAAEERYHRKNGELAAVAEHRGRLLAELEILTAAEGRTRRLAEERAVALARAEEARAQAVAESEALRAALAAESEQLRRTYAEIERLNGQIRAMEASVAWRLHRLWHREGK